MSTSLRSLLVAGLVVANALQAQVPAEVVVGSRVRIHGSGLPKSEIVGTVTARDTATLTVQAIDQAATNRVGSLQYAEIPVALPAITELDISRGKHSNAGKGSLIGFGIGAGLGLTLGVAALSDNCSDCIINFTPGDVAALTVITGAIGAVGGALIGALSHSDKWERILPARTSFTPVLRPSPTAPGRVDIGVSLRF